MNGKMSSSSEYSSTADLIILGAGPGGYVAALQAAHHGLSVICVDERAHPGGTCLHEGCIPSKILLHTTGLYAQHQHWDSQGLILDGHLRVDLPKLMSYKTKTQKSLMSGLDGLMQKNKIQMLKGRGVLHDAHTVHVMQEAKCDKPKHVLTAKKAIILATGSQPMTLPNVMVDEEMIFSARGLLSYEKQLESLIVIGGGYIGLEMASVWNRLGTRVAIVEADDDITPTLDVDVRKELRKQLSRQGFSFHLKTRVQGVDVQGNHVTVNMTHGEGEEGHTTSLTADAVLVAIGRRPNIAQLRLDAVGIQTDARDRIQVDENFQTSCPGIYAIGDLITGPMLAHKASDEGMAVADFLVGKSHPICRNAIPSVVYTEPEVASVGYTEDSLKSKGIAYTKGMFPFKANSRAQILNETNGFVKILADQATDRVLGVHIVGSMAESLISEAAMAIAFSASSEDIARICHPHPSLSETVREAAFATFSRPLHK